MAYDKSFYEAMAQVLPILILVMAVGELRWRAEEGFAGLLWSLGTMGLLILGEFLCLAALASGTDSRLEGGAVIVAFAVGCTHLFYEYAEIAVKEATNGKKASRRDRALIAFAGVFVGAVLLGGFGVIIVQASF